MTLDPPLSDRELAERYKQRMGKDVPGLTTSARPSAASGFGRIVSTDPIDPYGRMNGWERARARELELLKTAGEIRWWLFGDIGLRLAKATFYHPDFLYQRTDGSIVVEEVKGHMRDDAAVKLKVAARNYPMLRILLLTRPRGAAAGWHVREVTP